MKKYRIKQIGEKYYPQYKFLWFWLTIRNEGYYKNRKSWEWDLDLAKNIITERLKEKKVTFHKYP